MDPGDLRRDAVRAQRAAAGDESAWREIYESTCQTLFNFLCYQVGDREVAKDLLQETYLAAAQNLGRYLGKGTLLSWLRTIALRKSLDWRRAFWQRIRRVGTQALETVESSPPPSDAHLDTESLTFHRALGRLSAKQRAALLLRELEGLSYKEIAEALGCREATARVHYHRGCQKMRQMLVEAGATPLAKEPGGQQA
jgi:RNA polymerase sigma-70 factor (ECF subfamily)